LKTQSLGLLTLGGLLCEVTWQGSILGELTLRGLLCSYYFWDALMVEFWQAYFAVFALFILLLAGFKAQPWEAYFAHSNSWRAYFASLTLKKLLGSLKVLESSLHARLTL
jgi:hypothetical protein